MNYGGEITQLQRCDLAMGRSMALEKYPHTRIAAFAMLDIMSNFSPWHRRQEMMTEPYTETIRSNVDSPYDYPVLTADLVLCHFESAVAHEVSLVDESSYTPNGR